MERPIEAPSSSDHTLINIAAGAGGVNNNNGNISSPLSSRGARWPTIDGPLGLSEEESLGQARNFFRFGFLLLPWLWAVNCFYFWPILRKSTPHSHPQLRYYVVGSAIGCLVFTALLSSWALTFALGGEHLFGPVWNDLVMYNVADRKVMVSAKEELDSSLPPAIDGLLKVHKRVVDGLDSDSSHAPPAGVKVTTRLLVPATQAGNLIGKQGTTVKSIQEDSSCIVRAGGAQAISAMAWGTESCPKVDKIYGPGNQYVTAAKMILQNSEAMISIDMPAGPSEVLVIADKHASPVHIAADLLSQAEHGSDSQVVLVITGDGVDPTVIHEEIGKQCQSLPRGDLALKALSHANLVS